MKNIIRELSHNKRCRLALKEIVALKDRYQFEFLVFDQENKTLKLIESFCVNKDYIQINTRFTQENK